VEVGKGRGGKGKSTRLDSIGEWELTTSHYAFLGFEPSDYLLRHED
jgi:hypothetical protein